MTREEAITEYCAAIKDHSPDSPESKQRVLKAFAAMKPFLEGGKLPADLHKMARGMLK